MSIGFLLKNQIFKPIKFCNEKRIGKKLFLGTFFIVS